MFSVSRLSFRPSSSLPLDRQFSSPIFARRHYSDIVKENDIILLRHISNPSSPIVSRKLRKGRLVQLLRDSIRHDEIIGKRIRESTYSKRGIQYRITRPTLGEYTDHSSRIVTPIYSQDANLIVSLLDLNPTVPDANNEGEEKLEIFEAGTGHGALTMHLARAIHAANTTPPALPLPESERKHPTAQDESDGAQEKTTAQQEEAEGIAAYEDWRSKRRAVIHTLDINQAHSAYAQVNIRNFRDAMYYHHIDFHVGSIQEYLSSRLEKSSNTPFLSHAILDLPGTEEFLATVAKSLKPSGTLVVFCPHITQVHKCLAFVKNDNLPLFLEKTLELGSGIGVGGREWDLRMVKPRAVLKAEVEAEAREREREKDGSISETDSVAMKDDWQLVCRPKVGLLTAGGGFVGVFRRTVDLSKEAS